jgi:hypothetical protein
MLHPVSTYCVPAPAVAHSWRTVQLIVEHRHLVLHVCRLRFAYIITSKPTSMNRTFVSKTPPSGFGVVSVYRNQTSAILSFKSDDDALNY